MDKVYHNCLIYPADSPLFDCAMQLNTDVEVNYYRSGGDADPGWIQPLTPSAGLISSIFFSERTWNPPMPAYYLRI